MTGSPFSVCKFTLSKKKSSEYAELLIPNSPMEPSHSTHCSFKSPMYISSRPYTISNLRIDTGESLPREFLNIMILYKRFVFCIRTTCAAHQLLHIATVKQPRRYSSNSFSTSALDGGLVAAL